jgi:YegS/Rv2252/BmrU family lipid kinase
MAAHYYRSDALLLFPNAGGSRIIPRMAASDWFIIVNPASGEGRAKRHWPALARALTSAGVRFEASHSEYPGHAEQLAQDGLAAGYRRLLAVGGDGSIHELVNGVFAARSVDPRDLIVGVAPLGSGNDFARAYGIPSRPDDMARLLLEGRSRLHDVGRLVPEGPCGPSPEEARCFVNVAGAGIDGYVLERLPVGIPKRLGYLVAALRSLPGFRAPEFSLELDGQVRSARWLLTLVAISPYCGGGMRFAPQAIMDDGLADVVTVDPISLPRALRVIRPLFDGRFLQQPFVQHRLAASLRIDADVPVPLQADGQRAGFTPVRITILPRAIRVLAS